MKKIILLGFVGGAAISAGLAEGASAQAVDNYFSRDRNVAVLDRAKDDYAPLGLDLGGFMLQPYSGVDVGQNDNVKYASSGKKSSSFISLTPGFDAVSNWNQHMLNFGVSSNFTDYSSVSSENINNWHAYAEGRYDISSHMSVTANVAHDTGSESRASPFADLLDAKPVKYSSDALALGYSVVGNRLKLVLGATADKQKYDDVASTAGGIIDETYRNASVFDQSAQLYYAVSPAVSIYASADENQRRYDMQAARVSDSSGATYSIGSDFDLTNLIRGNVQIGTIEQDYRHISGGKLNNLYYNGKVEWFPSPLMTVTASAGRSYVETIAIGISSFQASGHSGALESTVSVGIDHELLRNLILSASVGSDKYQFTGVSRVDTTTVLNFGAQYYLNRRISIRAGYSYSKLDSTGSSASRSYNDNVLRIGLLFRY